MPKLRILTLNVCPLETDKEDLPEGALGSYCIETQLLGDLWEAMDEEEQKLYNEMTDNLEELLNTAFNRAAEMFSERKAIRDKILGGVVKNGRVQ